MPQFPQFAGSAAAFTSQPSTTLRLQSMNPCAQVLVHDALKHVVPGHPVSHEWQLRASNCRSAQWPAQHVSFGLQREHGSASASGPESGTTTLPPVPAMEPPVLVTRPPDPVPPVSARPPSPGKPPVPLLASTSEPPRPPLPLAAPPEDDGTPIEKSSSSAAGQPTAAKRPAASSRVRTTRDRRSTQKAPATPKAFAPT
jgi:hypothetical protein